MKYYSISINKNELFYDIDALTHKTTEARIDMPEKSSVKSTYAIKTDESELDRSLLTRMLDYRDSQLRAAISKYLSEETDDCSNNDLRQDVAEYIYSLEMRDDWNGNLLKPLTDKIHRYLVYGTLYDYYLKTSPELVNSLGEIDEIKEALLDILRKRNKNIFIRPPRPF